MKPKACLLFNIKDGPEADLWSDLPSNGGYRSLRSLLLWCSNCIREWSQANYMLCITCMWSLQSTVSSVLPQYQWCSPEQCRVLTLTEWGQPSWSDWVDVSHCTSPVMVLWIIEVILWLWSATMILGLTQLVAWSSPEDAPIVCQKVRVSATHKPLWPSYL